MYTSTLGTKLNKWDTHGGGGLMLYRCHFCLRFGWCLQNSVVQWAAEEYVVYILYIWYSIPYYIKLSLFREYCKKLTIWFFGYSIDNTFVLLYNGLVWNLLDISSNSYIMRNVIIAKESSLQSKHRVCYDYKLVSPKLQPQKEATW